MIQIFISDDFFQYDAYHITKAFFPNSDIKVDIVNDSHKNSLLLQEGEIRKFQIMDDVNTSIAIVDDPMERKKIKHYMNQQLYLSLCDYTGRKLKWGFMTGIRPTKATMKKWLEYKNIQESTSESKIRNLTIEELSDTVDKETKEWLKHYYNVSDEKSELAVQIVNTEHDLLSHADLINGYSLYIGIPFCKTRCTYCSFTAYPLDKWIHRMDEYMESLVKELKFIAKQSVNKKLDTIYIGGGTPTSLNEAQLEQLFIVLREYFSYDQVNEITVEAGRPDTITKDKLMVMKRYGVNRISINPQSMNDKTLQLVGRSHDSGEIKKVYSEARELGFDNINMDIILGLPGEGLEELKTTLDEIIKLAPDSLTVHSLAKKKRSIISQTSDVKKMNSNTSIEDKNAELIKEAEMMSEMIELSNNCASELGLKPYYLYRQKSIAGNFENIGYAKESKECLYNVLIMEEKQSIVAAGAGSASKILLNKKRNNVVRIENVKDVNEYISRIDEMIERKGEHLWH